MIAYTLHRLIYMHIYIRTYMHTWACSANSRIYASACAHAYRYTQHITVQQKRCTLAELDLLFTLRFSSGVRCRVAVETFFNLLPSLGFKNVCTIEDVADAYPLLDMIDHDNRRRVVSSFHWT